MIYIQSMQRSDSALTHNIRLSSDFDMSKGIGLVPVPNATKSIMRDDIETEGLRWNIGPDSELTTLSWDSMISTSNELDGDTDDRTIKVKSFGHPLFLSTTLKPV